MPILGKFEVQVFVDGTRAEEFDDDEEGVVLPGRRQETTKYIEAVSGAFFEFKFFAEANYKFLYDHAISFDVFVDGEHIIGTYMQDEEFRGATVAGRRVDGSCSGRYSMDSTGSKLYKFQFADLETRDLELNDDVSNLKEKYGDLGTLKVEVWPIMLLDTHPARDYSRKDLETVPEKALKGRPLDVATRLAPVTVTDTIQSRRRQFLGDQPLATFKFKYRTRRMFLDATLSALLTGNRCSTISADRGTISHSGTLGGPASGGTIREEALELLRREREQRHVKQEPRTKRERSIIVTGTKLKRPFKTSKGNSGETIYHLDSDDEEGKGALEEPASRPKPTKVEIINLLEDD